MTDCTVRVQVEEQSVHKFVEVDFAEVLLFHVLLLGVIDLPFCVSVVIEAGLCQWCGIFR